MARYVKSFPVSGSSDSLATSSSVGGGANAVVTLAAPATNHHVYLTDVVWSYSTAPSSGGLNVYDGSTDGTLVMSLDVTAGGPDGFPFPPLGGGLGQDVTVELLQAGSSIVGRLNAYGYSEA